MKTRHVTLVLLLVTVLALPAFAAGAKGEYHFRDYKFVPVDMIAYQGDDPDTNAPVTIVLMSDFKIDRDAVMKAIHPVDALFAQMAKQEKSNTVMVVLTEPGKCRVAALLDQGQQQVTVEGSATVKSNDASHVSGNCYTPKPGKMFDDTYEFDLPFDLSLTKIPKPTPLPSDGGDPGKQLVAVFKAIEAKDWKSARLHLRDEEIARNPKPDEYKSFFEGLALNYPKSATATGGLIKGDLAQVDIKAVDYEGKKLEGYFTMKKVDGNWRVVEQFLHYSE